MYSKSTQEALEEIRRVFLGPASTQHDVRALARAIGLEPEEAPTAPEPPGEDPHISIANLMVALSHIERLGKCDEK